MGTYWSYGCWLEKTRLPCPAEYQPGHDIEPLIHRAVGGRGPEWHLHPCPVQAGKAWCCLHSLARSPGLSLSPWMSDRQIHALPLFGSGEGHPSWLPTDEGENYWSQDKKQAPDVLRNIRSWKIGPPCVLLPQLSQHSAPLPHAVAS